MLLKTQSWKTQILLFIEMLFGSILMAASFGLIIIPQEFSAGGVTGLAKVLQSVLPVNLSVLVFFFNMILLLAGFLFIGKEFVAKTVAVSILFPLFLEFFAGFSVNSLKEDALVSVLIAGCMLGIGAGLIIRSGASGGGFDTLAIILHQKFGLPVAAIMNFCDVSVILLQIVGHPVLKSIYGIMAITLSSFIVKQVITFGSGELQVMVFSDKYEQIRDALFKEADVGLTYLNAESGFQKKSMKVIVSVIPYSKLQQTKQVIQSIDQTAFVVVDQVRNVLGRGYTLSR